MALKLIPSIHRATHRIGLYLATSAERGLTQGEAHILAHLADGPTTVGALHRALAHKRSTLTSILDRLHARGLITREVGASDRRTVLIAPTARGRRTADAVRRHLEALERAALAGLSAADIRAAERVLAAIERTAAGTSRVP